MRREVHSIRDRTFARRLAAGLALFCLAFDAAASGWAPFARSDSFTVERGGTADQLDSGNYSVLDNDFDFERDPLTARLEKKPKRGTLELREDGTFLYTHDGSQDETDEFEYRAFDGTGESGNTLVTISIVDVPNAPPEVTGDVPDQEAIAETAFSLELAGYFFDPDPGDELRFEARGLPASASLTLDPATGLLSGIPLPGDARPNPYDVEVTATDLAGDSASLTFALLIRELDRADVALELRVLGNPIGVGETLRWELVVENRGPGVFEQGVLTADWATSGPALDLSAPAECTLAANNTASPTLSCNVNALDAGGSTTYAVDGLQDDDGENSLIGRLAADEDTEQDNNFGLASAQIVAAFSEGPTQVVNMASTDMDTGDFDNDGHIDIVVAGTETTVFYNTGDRALTTPGTSVGPASSADVVTVLDWDGDGDDDIAAAGAAARLYVNDGAGNFSVTEPGVAAAGAVNDIAAADLDNDGSDELLLAGSAGLVTVRGNSDISTLSNIGVLAVASADLDLDGDDDVVAIRATDRAVQIFNNNGTGTFFTQVEFQPGSAATVSLANLDNGGAPELLLGLDGSDLEPPRHLVLTRQSDGQYAVTRAFGAAPASQLLTGDIDGDGRTDVAAINNAGVHQVYRGTSSGDLELDDEQIVSDGMRRGSLVDFNGDGSLDLILVGGDAGALEIHANNGKGRLGLGDRVAPDLQLIGESSMVLPAGAEYVEPGATAIDDIDGDISSLVEITGTVNTASVGTHQLNYKVTDRAGNTSSAVRTVRVGVNEGTGGGGGGTMSTELLLLFAVLAILAHLRRSSFSPYQPARTVAFRTRRARRAKSP